MLDKKEDTSILVSICCITYNHASYIRQCLDGFIMQKTDFTFEILIHDDASTDGTEEIIREYAIRYPETIKPLYEKENQWVLGRRGSKTFNYPRAKGKYIALCEGDDYWTDPLKLQKQVDFLEANPDYSMCFHNAIESWDNGEKEDVIFSNITDRDYEAVEVYKNWIIPTASVLFKVNIIQSEFYTKVISSNKTFIFGDIVLFLTCSKFGKIRGMKDVMSVYRRHKGGVVFAPSLERDYRQSLHDQEIGSVFGDEIRKVANVLCFKRSLKGYLYSKNNNKVLAEKNAKMFSRMFKLSYLVFVPRIIASFIKHPNFYK